MQRRLRSGIAALGLLSALIVPTLGGCPPVAAQHELAPPPAGRYWVEPRSTGQLYGYELPATRDEEGRWMAVDFGQPEWFSGDGLYELSLERSWSRLDEGGLTLDDVLQTYDALPRAAE